MATMDVRFSGSVPANYEKHLVPLLFRPYAEILAERAAQYRPRDILETAAGTGVVTNALAQALPDARIVATDLNQAMLDVAETRVASGKVTFRQADALDLPFEDGSFDLVVCQFGVMFYPDKVRGNSEARRVLRDGGHYLTAIWDRIDRNILSNIANESMRELFPDNPPQFMTPGAVQLSRSGLDRRRPPSRGFRRHRDRDDHVGQPQRVSRGWSARARLRFSDGCRVGDGRLWAGRAGPRLRESAEGDARV
jgi:SAM-dependent methyltransferase